MPKTTRTTPPEGPDSTLAASHPAQPGTAGAAEDKTMSDKVTGMAGDVRGRAAEAASTVSESAGAAAAAVQDAAAGAAGRVAGAARQGYDTARERAGEAYDASRRGVRYASRKSGEMGRSIEGYFDENPLMIGAFSFLGGLVIGSLLPRTRQEDRYFGPSRDELARDALARGRQFSHEARDYAGERMSEFRRSVEQDAHGTR